MSDVAFPNIASFGEDTVPSSTVGSPLWISGDSEEDDDAIRHSVCRHFPRHLPGKHYFEIPNRSGKFTGPIPGCVGNSPVRARL